MRRRIVAADLIESVIGLGPNLFYNSPMEACIVVCRSAKPASRVGKVLFIAAVNEVTRERAQSFLTSDHIDRIASAFRSFEAEDGFAAVTPVDAIADLDNNLSIPLHVDSMGARPKHDLDAALDEWRQSASELRSAAHALFARLDEEATL